jgi:hypothetical protein
MHGFGAAVQDEERDGERGWKGWVIALVLCKCSDAYLLTVSSTDFPGSKHSRARFDACALPKQRVAAWQIPTGRQRWILRES